MKRMLTVFLAALTGLLTMALPALAVSEIYTDVEGTGGGVTTPVGQITTPVDPGAATGALAQTGFDVTLGALLALTLLAVGIVALFAARRRGAMRTV